MKKITIESLCQNQEPFSILIRSLSPYLYRVEVTVNDKHCLLTSALDKSSYFKNIESVRALFAQHALTPTQILLHQHTTYSEMIGMEEGSIDDMLLPLHW